MADESSSSQIDVLKNKISLSNSELYELAYNHCTSDLTQKNLCILFANSIMKPRIKLIFRCPKRHSYSLRRQSVCWSMPPAVAKISIAIWLSVFFIMRPAATRRAGTLRSVLTTCKHSSIIFNLLLIRSTPPQGAMIVVLRKIVRACFQKKFPSTSLWKNLGCIGSTSVNMSCSSVRLIVSLEIIGQLWFLEGNPLLLSNPSLNSCKKSGRSILCL